MEEIGYSSSESLGVQSTPESWEKFTEEDIIRIREWWEKAKAVATKSKASRAKNTKLAEFLTFLLKEIKNEKITSGIFHVFFKTKHPDTKKDFLRKSPNIIVIVGMFAPFFPTEAKKYNIETIYKEIHNFHSIPNKEEYISYIKKLSAKYHDNIPIYKQDFIEYLIQLLHYFKISWYNQLTQENKKQLYIQINEELFA